MSLRTDLDIVQLPGTLPNVGGLLGLNTIVTDPSFGTQIVRLTDGSSGSGNFDSMQTDDDPSGYAMWNTDDTMILARSTGGNAFIFQFNPSTLQGTQLGTAFPYKLSGACTFSKVSNGVLYNCPQGGTVVNQLNFALVGGVWTYQSTVELCDFAAILPAGFDVTWQSELEVSAGDAVFTLAFSNAGDQNTGFYCCLYKPGSGFRMINTQTLEVSPDSQWGAIGTATLENTPVSKFFLHGVNQPPNPEYTCLGPATLDDTFIWANETLTITSTGLGGHHGIGWVNLYTGNPGGGQYDEVPFTNPATHSTIIPTQAGPPGLPADQTPAQVYTGDQHSAMGPLDLNDKTLLWITNGAPPTFPFTSCWMGEVRGLDVTGAISGAQGTVYRACHTNNSGKSTEYIVANALASPSQTGNFIAFTSDWAGAGEVGPLGSTSGAPTGVVGVNARGDVFIVALNPSLRSLAVSTSGFPNGIIGTSFSQGLQATSGEPPYTSWAITAGSLPPGLILVSSLSGGKITGTPTAAGTYNFTVTVTDSAANTASANLSITVNAALAVATSSLAAGLTATGYSAALQVNGGVAPFTWALSSGSLPPGLALSSTGAIYGTPNVAGTFSFVVTVMDSEMPSPATASASLSIAITAPAGRILPALYAQLALQAAILQLIGPGAYNGAPANVVSAFFFGAASKQPPQRFIVINLLDGPPAATTLDQTTALKDGEFQFDSYAETQLVARQISQAIRDLLIDLVATALPNGVVITFTENTVDRDLGYEVGAESYVFRSLLRLRAFYTESGAALPVGGPNLYEGYGAPTALHNNDDLYYDLGSGNVYEQQAFAWELVGNIPVGGGDNMQPSEPYHLVAASGVNANVIKSAAGLVTGWKIQNDTEYPVYVKLFNKATTPVPGTDTPFQTIGVQAGAPAELSINGGITYSAGIAIAITKGIADLDSTPVINDDVVVDIFYQ